MTAEIIAFPEAEPMVMVCPDCEEILWPMTDGALECPECHSIAGNAVIAFFDPDEEDGTPA